ncbi:hypothetical protein EOW77_0003510 [Bradyrhizobium yuanmingense]|uniref:hypothetical protein n=1 Tax=Bradyrhizobium yuanmingense TaxID=108015 RepID=UPI000FE430BB|nr:hypothetical protein [Bradyrhizobium yuanmingense]TGN90913.1 hypothetical protein EOW77_0003510 [Bradyrhizobium yuanmingense]
MALRRHIVSVTTAADGSATAYSPFLSGYIHEIHYIKTDFADGVDFAITAEATGETIWTQSDVNAAAVKAPRQATHSNVGVAALFAAGGTAVNDRIALGRDRVKIVIAQGGNAKSGAFHIVIDDAK